jgi:hypothetical protein
VTEVRAIGLSNFMPDLRGDESVLLLSAQWRVWRAKATIAPRRSGN